MKVAVVTPTIGSEHLAQCIESVQNQTYENLTHYIFLDGEEHFQKIYPQALDKTKRQIKSIGLQENIGKGWYGHRVYAACSFLVNADGNPYGIEIQRLVPGRENSTDSQLNPHIVVNERGVPEILGDMDSAEGNIQNKTIKEPRVFFLF